MSLCSTCDSAAESGGAAVQGTVDAQRRVPEEARGAANVRFLPLLSFGE